VSIGIVFGIPYPALLGLLVFLLDLVPVIGSTVGGIIVTLVALTVSLPVAIATAVFTPSTGWPRTTCWSRGSSGARSRSPRWRAWSRSCSAASSWASSAR
jgi:hypothetical protein